MSDKPNFVLVTTQQEPEPEEPGIPLTEEPVDRDVIPDHLPDRRQLVMERDHGVEQAVDRQPLGLEVDSEVDSQR